MDFVDWCTYVLSQVVADAERSPDRRAHGFFPSDIERTVFGAALVQAPGYGQSSAPGAVSYALSALEGLGLLINDWPNRSGIRAAPNARDFIDDPAPW